MNKILTYSKLSILACGIAACVNTATAQVYTYAGTVSTDVIGDTSNAFGALSGETLTIGATSDVGGRFDATATAINSSSSQNPAPVINVYGTSSLEFSGNNNATRIQSLTVNFEDQSKFLINAGNAIFRERVVINYNSGAASSSTGDLRLQNATTFSTFNFNSGSVSVAQLNLTTVPGLLNLNGGNFSATSLNFTAGGAANINFTSGSSIFTVTGVAADYLDAAFADGLFQIDGIDKLKTDFDVADASGNLTVALASVSPVPEPSSVALLMGLMSLGLITCRRRQRA